MKGAEAPLVALVLRGDHELNELKAEKHDGVAAPLVMADEAVVKEALGCDFGSIGPVGIDIPVIVDHEAAALVDFACGANEDDYHWVNVNWERDCPLKEVADIRNVVEGDTSPDGKGPLKFMRGIEVGHIFQNGDKYSKPLAATVLNEGGKSVTVKAGCYGIGISRIVAAAIEQNHDDRGIVWPKALAPFEVVIIPIQMHKSYRCKEAAEKLYEDLIAAGVDVLLDDRKERPGVMFADMDLVGVPHRVVLGERGIDAGTIEYKSRSEADAEEWPLEEALKRLLTKVKA